MQIKRMRLWKFKNYDDKLFEFDPHINILAGPNGSGKTNVLEAIHFMALTKPHSTLTERQISRNGCGEYRIEMLTREEEERSVYVLTYGGGQKRISKNKEVVGRLADHIGDIPLVSIFPDDVDLVRGDASYRRKLLNQSISQLSRSYLDASSRYKRCILQRNRLLKQEEVSPSSKEALLDTYDQEMIHCEKIISTQRINFVQELVPSLTQLYTELTDSKEEYVHVEVRSNYAYGHFDKALKDTRQKDLITQRSNIGPHKDDLRFLINDRILKKYGSQGQIKSFLICFKLAHFLVFRTHLRRKPLLLMDDIFDKLDVFRVRRLLYLVNSLDFGQIFITHTAPEDITHQLRNLEVAFKVFNITPSKGYNDEEE